MAIYKNDNGTWYVMIRYQDWTGARKQKCKRVIIPGLSEPPVRTLRATIPENGSHIFR